MLTQKKFFRIWKTNRKIAGHNANDSILLADVQKKSAYCFPSKNKLSFIVFSKFLLIYNLII
jgi:hypothetical protein